MPSTLIRNQDVQVVELSIARDSTVPDVSYNDKTTRNDITSVSHQYH
jgi:hypothetical protein